MNNNRRNKEVLNDKINKCSTKLVILTVIGLIFLITGIVLCSSWPHHYGAFDSIVYSRTKLWGFKFWNDALNTSKNLEFYFFNWTNPKEWKIPGKKPNFIEVGPYSFTEKIQKVNIIFHPENDTVSYDKLKFWYFDREKSIGSLNDEITQLNVRIILIAHNNRHLHFKSNTSSLLWKTAKIKLFVKKSVKKLLFTNCTDPAIRLVNKELEKDTSLSGHYGWYYKVLKNIIPIKILWNQQNGTVINGHVNMETEENTLTNLGLIKNWNYKNTTPYYETECNHIEGNSGEFWPPDRKTGDIRKWMADLCRPVIYEFTEKTTYKEIPGYKYSFGDKTLENSACYCNGVCNPKGIINATACYQGGPVFISLPHFYKGDSILRDKITGMNPNEADHSSYITLNPNTGIPLNTVERFQINALIQPSSTISQLNNISSIYFPILWMNVKSVISENSTENLHKLLQLANAVSYSCIAILILGGTIFLVIAIILYLRIQSEILRVSKKANHGNNKRKSRQSMERIRLTQEECHYNERLI